MFSFLFGSDGGDTSRQILHEDNINEAVKMCKYDVRGEIYLAAVKRAQEGKEVIYTNVGNPHAVGESPITFSRQVLSLVSGVWRWCSFGTDVVSTTLPRRHITTALQHSLQNSIPPLSLSTTLPIRSSSFTSRLRHRHRYITHYSYFDTVTV